VSFKIIIYVLSFKPVASVSHRKIDEIRKLAEIIIDFFWISKGSIRSCPENFTKADDFSDLLGSSQSSGKKSWPGSWNKIKAT